MLETGVYIVFYPDQKLHFVTSSESLVIGCKRSKRVLFEISWQVLVYFFVLKAQSFLTLV